MRGVGGEVGRLDRKRTPWTRFGQEGEIFRNTKYLVIVHFDETQCSFFSARAVKLMGAAVEAKYSYLFGVNRSMNDNGLIF